MASRRHPAGFVKIALVSDAWTPQVNGAARTLAALQDGLNAAGHRVLTLTPDLFAAVRCPTEPGVRLAVGVRHRLAQRLDDFAPEAIHIATESPLGLAARRYCAKRRLFFTTAYHTKFPEYFRARFGIPLPWGYAALRHFHARSELCMTSRRHPAGIRENCPGQRSVGAASQW